MTAGDTQPQPNPRGSCLEHSGLVSDIKNLGRSMDEVKTTVKEGFDEMRDRLADLKRQGNGNGASGEKDKSMVMRYIICISTLVMALVGIATLAKNAYGFLKGLGG